MGRTTGIAIILAFCLILPAITRGEPEDFKGPVAGKKLEVLFPPQRSLPQPIPLPKNSKLVPLEDLQFIGPRPGHPFVLGHYAVDGSWGIVNGGLQVVEGKNAAVQLGWAGDFELEGVMEQSGLGGWFFLLGWNEGRGFALSNVLMRESGSPWFITEFRGTKAIEERSVQLDDFDWRGEQPFKLIVRNQTFSLDVGRFHVFSEQPMAGYTPGRVVLGIYDTRYGPKTVRVKSLRWKALPPLEEQVDSKSSGQ